MRFPPGFFSPQFFSLRRDSLRTRLMAWNMITLALILTLVGGLIQFSVQRTLLTSIDRELEVNQPPFRHLDRDTPADIRDALLPPDAKQGDGGPLHVGGGHGPHHHGPDDQPNDARNGPDGGPQGGQNAPPGDHAPRNAAQTDAASDTEDAPVVTPEHNEKWHRPRLFSPTGTLYSPKASEAPASEAAFREAVAGRLTFTDGTFDDEPARLLYRPMRFGGRVVAVAQSAYPLTEVNRAISSMRQALLALIPVALLLAGIGGAWLTDRALRPVRQITFAAEQIGADDLSRRLFAAGDDEFARLAVTINGMLARLETTFMQRETLVRQLQELIAQQQRFTGDASHELRTPLTIIKANASLLLPASPTAAEWREGMEEINSAADSMTRLVQDLLLLTRSDGGQLGRGAENISLAAALEKAIRRVRRPDAAAITLRTSDDPLTVRGNADELTRLFCNLIENAQRHTPSSGAIEITAERQGDKITASVRDNGAGIAPEHLPHLCERFYRVDSARSRPDGGTGLGLAICKSIADAHGGTLAFASEPGKGATVTVTLPAAQ